MYPFGVVALGSVPVFTSSFALYSAVNVFTSTVPVVGTVSLHLSNSFVLSLYVALAGICSFTFALSHAVPFNTSITLYLFVPSIVLFSPASKVTLVYPFGVVALGSVPVFTSSFTVKAFVSSCKLPLLIVTGWSLSVNFKSAPFSGFVVILYVSKSLNATSFVKP